MSLFTSSDLTLNQMATQISSRQAQFVASIEAAVTPPATPNPSDWEWSHSNSSSAAAAAVLEEETDVVMDMSSTPPPSPIIPISLPRRSSSHNIQISLPGIELVDTIRLLTEYANSLHAKIESMRESYYKSANSTGEHHMMPPEFDVICCQETVMNSHIHTLQSHL